MQQFSQRIRQVNESFSIAFADRVRALQANGVSISALQTGDPNFDTPRKITVSAANAMHTGHTHYSNSRGLPALREAVASYIRHRHGLDYDPAREILMTHGAVHAYYAALAAIINPGDEVLVPDPSWQTHNNMVTVVGGKGVRVPSTPENGFFPLLSEWEAALTEQTVALVLNTPNNPTGAVAGREYLTQLVQFATDHDLYILSDEVYDHLVYDDNTHVSLASIPGAKERTWLINSFSKTFAMTGWRVGYLCAPAAAIDEVLKVSQHSITNLAPFIQHGGITAMTDEDVQEEVQGMIDAYTRRRTLVKQIYDAEGQDNPLRLTMPGGTFYYFLDVRELGIPSMTICERLLTEAGVAVLPGSVYGNSGEGFIRMTIAASEGEIETGFRSILRWCSQQSE